MANALDITAKGRYDELHSNRTTTLDRAELCSTVTIPYLFMAETATSQDDLARGYAQGFGAKLVNHLVGKFALSILPPSQPFYRLSATQEAMQKITQGDETAQMEVEKVLSTKEEGILRYINKSKFRASLYPALRLSMVTGDSLIEKMDDEKYRVFNMRNYVIKRDSAGTIIDLIIKETLDYDAVPDEIRGSIDDKNKDEPVELFTRVYLEEKVYKRYQEIAEVTVAGSETDIKNLSDIYISVRWNKIDGEDYGRGFVEEHLGTLISLEKQSKVLNESATVSSKIVFTVNPNGMTKYKDYVGAKNGDAIIGKVDDIGVVRADKSQDLSVTYNLVQDYKKELAEAFLMGSAAIRDAERVTAQEVQLVASELEASFGGIYTAIAEDIQLPLVQNAMKTLKIDGGNDVDVIITAGVEALGRNVELSMINSLLQELGILAQLVGAEKVAEKINVGAFANAMVANSGVASKNFIFTETQTAQNSVDQTTGEVVKGAVATGANEAAKTAVQPAQ